MCGFVGYVGETAPVDRTRLIAMRDRMTHRGPDDAGVLIRNGNLSVGLAHRRLSILDTRSVGQQPMSTQNDRFHIVYNGEFYSFMTERNRLKKMGYGFQSRTDTEVILALFAESGVACFDRIDGMFGFAIWDSLEQELTLVRDRLGIKPVFYSTTATGSLLFASEVKALLESKCIDDSINLQAHHDYLGLNYVPGDQTMVNGIRKLPPGHYLTWKAGRISIKRYWSQTFGTDQDVYQGNFETAAEDIMSCFDAAVERRLVSDVPLGMFLSGGIDSSAILNSMSRLHSGPVKAFTIAFEEASYDESNFARVAAGSVGADHHIELVKPDPDTVLAPLIQSLDEPYADSSVIPLWYLCRLAKRHVTVALGGDGGDELFAGYRTHYAWKLARLWKRVPKPIRINLANRVVGLLPTSHKKMSFDLKARAFIRAASRPAIDAHYGFKEFMPESVRRAMLDSSDELDETVRLFRRATESMSQPGSLDAILAADFEIYLPDDILVKVDRISMLHSLEARVPFLDHRLVELAAKMPGHYKLKGLKTKAVLKQALKNRVPGQLLKRRKAGFNVPMAQWLSGPLQPLMMDLLDTQSVSRVGLWRTDDVQSLISSHLNRSEDNSRSLWAMMCFMLFNQEYREGRAA
ncbi:MAG: asparagine synthase (glutamine-hydrolyzing) [Myxococcales bacterium]|nr:asparagine synthase (glutamine-hydrolyzing) [Myxococcales bacterium]